jgi:hypothetical protein
MSRKSLTNGHTVRRDVSCDLGILGSWDLGCMIISRVSIGAREQ